MSLHRIVNIIRKLNISVLASSRVEYIFLFVTCFLSEAKMFWQLFELEGRSFGMSGKTGFQAGLTT